MVSGNEASKGGINSSELRSLTPAMPEWMVALGEFPRIAVQFSQDQASVTVFGIRKIPNTSIDEVTGSTVIPLEALDEAKPLIDEAFDYLYVRSRVDPIRVALERVDDHLKKIYEARSLLQQVPLVKHG